MGFTMSLTNIFCENVAAFAHCLLMEHLMNSLSSVTGNTETLLLVAMYIKGGP